MMFLFVFFFALFYICQGIMGAGERGVLPGEHDENSFIFSMADGCV